MAGGSHGYNLESTKTAGRAAECGRLPEGSEITVQRRVAAIAQLAERADRTKYTARWAMGAGHLNCQRFAISR